MSLERLGRHAVRLHVLGQVVDVDVALTRTRERHGLKVSRLDRVLLRDDLDQSPRVGRRRNGVEALLGRVVGGTVQGVGVKEDLVSGEANSKGYFNNKPEDWNRSKKTRSFNFEIKEVTGLTP